MTVEMTFWWQGWAVSSLTPGVPMDLSPKEGILAVLLFQGSGAGNSPKRRAKKLALKVMRLELLWES